MEAKLVSEMYREAISEAHSLVSAAPEGVPFETLFERLFAARTEALTVAEAMVLYPQFKALIAPALLRNIRASGLIGIYGGAWVWVAGNLELEQARREDRLTDEEHGRLIQACLAG